MSQRTENMFFLNRLLALFVEEVYEKAKAMQEIEQQTEFVNLIKDDILQTMRKRVGKAYAGCSKDKGCTDGQICVNGVCVAAEPGFTLPL